VRSTNSRRLPRLLPSVTQLFRTIEAERKGSNALPAASRVAVQALLVASANTRRAGLECSRLPYGADVQMNANTKALWDEKKVAAFPGRRLRHLQKQGSLEEELKTRRSPVQVELKFRCPRPPK
jgi:hypothetical protein